MTDRDDALRFIAGLKAVLDSAWQGRGKVRGYTAATEPGLARLYDLCIAYNPDAVLDIGTGAGASALTLALALTHAGKGAANVTTIGQLRDWFDVTLPGAGPLALEYGLDLREIDALAADFNDLKPQDYIVPGERLLLFYDIHDRGETTHPAHKLTGHWLPCLHDALVLIHDMCIEPFKVGLSNATLYDKLYHGYPEIKHLLPWVEGKGGHVTVYDDATIGALEFVEGVLL